MVSNLLRRKVLRNEILDQARNAEFIGPTIHQRFAEAKIIGRGRRREAPFKGVSAPRIAFCGFFAAEKTP
jgi:hypothetical protein